MEAVTFEGRTEVKEEEPEMEPEQGTRWEGEIQESVILRKLKEERLYKISLRKSLNKHTARTLGKVNSLISRVVTLYYL